MSASNKRMRGIMVQETPDSQEIYLQYIQKLQSVEDKLASFSNSTEAATGELEPLKDELASIKAGEAEIRSCFCAHMATTLWSTLPNELLQQIFARLPLADIIRLQCLSKTWKMNLTSRDSEFKRTCAEANPRMFAMLSEGNGNEAISVKLYDIKANRWHSYLHDLGEFSIDNLYAGDGGLVCVVYDSSTEGTEDMSLITVLNPLDPERSRVLPHHGLPRDFKLRMVQLVMDRDRRCYKVFLVGEKNGRVVANIFSSETGAWNGEISEGVVFGYQFGWDERLGFIMPYDRVGPCAYDFVGRQLLDLADSSHPFHQRTLESTECYALVEDHLFVLHREPDVGTDMGWNTYDCGRYSIWEYQGQKCKPHWVKVKVHRCKEFERPPTSVCYTMSLYACKGFLLMKAENEESEAYRHVLTWLYDMATEKWQAIPPFAGRVHNPVLDAMFELQWDAIP